MTYIGYARVSRHEQNLELQLDRLKEKGCTRIFTDKISGATFERKELEAALAFLRPGDVFVVWKLDRLGRSLRHLIDTITKLNERHVGFISLTESIDTTTAGGKLIFHIMGALAEFERDLIRERTNAGLEAARARGRKGGRPKTLPTSSKVALAQKLYAEMANGKHTYSIDDICRDLGISKATLYRYVNLGKKPQTDGAT
jgi:DNA invertase Pin-like site-specific DNA recombinase